MASLSSLPVELLLHIHLIALSPSLPLASAHIRQALLNNATPLYRADWIQAKLASEGTSLPSGSLLSSSASLNQRRRKGSKIPQFLSHALRFPICDRETLAILEARCLASLQRTARMEHSEQMKVVNEAIKLSPPQLPTVPALPSGNKNVLPPEQVFSDPELKDLSAFLPPYSVDVPKRLFRNLGSAATQCHSVFDSSDFPYVQHILDDLAGDADSSKGYALAKAVLARHLPLIRLLLSKGADPSLKDNMSIMLAIGRDDIELVKMLIEREQQYHEEQVQPAGNTKPLQSTSRSQYPGQGKKRKRKDKAGNGSSPGKRRRLEDRVPVTSAMLELAVRQKCEPLISYFMEKGAVPNIKTLSLLQG